MRKTTTDKRLQATTMALSLVLAILLMAFSAVSSASRAIADETNSASTGITAINSAESTTPSDSSNESDKDSGKEEVVYAKLSSSGLVNSIYVVNEFSLDSAGTLIDYGHYDSLTNLSTTKVLKQEGDKVTTEVEAGEFCYEGVLASKDLPWILSLSYTLDGKKISANELAGKSGAMEIHLTSKKNERLESSFYDNYMLQVSFTLDAEKSSDIASEGATIANAGKDKSIVHSIMPGKDANITIKAQVKDFEMPGIQIAGMPFSFSIEMPDTSSLIEKMDPLTEAVAKLNEGAVQISEGSSELAHGTTLLSQGSASFKSGLSQLSGNSQNIINGSSQIKQALEAMATGMNEGNSLDLSAFTQLSGALTTLSQGLTQMSSSLTQLRDVYSQAYAVLDVSISNLPANSVDASSLAALEALVAQDTTAEPALNQLKSGYAAAQAVRSSYYGPGGDDGAQAVMSQVVPALDGLTDPNSASSLDGMAASLSSMATQISAALESMDAEALQKLVDGLNQLSASYKQFHEGLLAYTGGVQAASSGYEQIHSALAATSEGAGQLSSGMSQLSSGVQQLNSGISQLPRELKTEIDKLMNDYDTADFKTNSFVSPKNEKVSLVQFIFTTEAIAVEKKPIAEEEPEASSSPLDQLFALFQK